MDNEERNYFWEKQQKSIPFLEGLPEEYKVHDQLIICPECGGELFGRCLCCQQYFCHGKCDGAIYDEEDILESLQQNKSTVTRDWN